MRRRSNERMLAYNKSLAPYRKLVESGRCEINLNNYRSLIAKYTWQVWRMLPIQTRIWVSIEDMMADASWFARYDVLPYWLMSGKQSKFSTLLVNQLHKYLENEYLAKHGAKQRWDGNTISIQDVQDRYADKGWSVEVERILRLRHHTPTVTEDCFITQAFPQLYDAASPALQRSLATWFLDQEPPKKLHVGTKQFRDISREFRRLAFWSGIEFTDCLHLVKSPTCLDKVSRQIRGVPLGSTYFDPTIGRREWLTCLQ